MNDVEEFAEKRHARGKAFPLWDERPILSTDFELDVWRGFQACVGTNVGAMGPARIPPSEVATWLDLEGLDDPAIRSDFFYCIQRVGDELLRDASRDSEPETAPNAT